MKIWGTFESEEYRLVKAKAEHMMELDELYEEEFSEDYPEGDFYEDWDNLEMGFDPYMGCYSDDC